MMTSLSSSVIADLVVIAIILVSGLMALARGFAHEVLSVAAWIGAAFTALYAFPFVQPWAHQFISINLLADAVAGGGTFIAALVLFSILTNSISRPIRRSAFSPLDRSLGFVFGLVRGLVVLGLIYLVVSWIFPPAEQPPWLKGAKTLPMVAQVSGVLKDLMPASLQPKSPENDPIFRKQREVMETAQKMQDAERALRGLSNPPPAPSHAPQGNGGYTQQERNGITGLIQSQGNQ